MYCIDKKKVLAICGSTRKNSSNHSLIKAIAALYSDTLEITLFDRLGDLPQFNPDDDNENVASEVASFRQQMSNAEGILICTPEYAHGVPGSLKNAIDWTVSSSSFPYKPTMLITASTDGSFGHRSLLDVLNAIEAKNINNLQMVISFVKTKIGNDDRITDEKTLNNVKRIVEAFIETMNENEPLQGGIE